MPSETDDVPRRLMHMRENIGLAMSFSEGLDYEAFRDDVMRLYAVTRCLEIISEASRHLPQDLKARHPSILWKDMAGAGNVYRHDYEDVAARYVWRTVQRELRPLLTVVEQELEAHEARGA